MNEDPTIDGARRGEADAVPDYAMSREDWSDLHAWLANVAQCANDWAERIGSEPTARGAYLGKLDSLTDTARKLAGEIRYGERLPIAVVWDRETGELS